MGKAGKMRRCSHVDRQTGERCTNTLKATKRRLRVFCKRHRWQHHPNEKTRVIVKKNNKVTKELSEDDDTRMHYQKYFDEIIDKCFESGEAVTSLLVKDKFIDRYGSRNTPHVNKISLMMRLCSKLSNPSQQRKGIQYRKR